MLGCVLLKTNNNTDDDSCRLVRFPLTWPAAIGAKESVKTLELTNFGQHSPRDINMAPVTSCGKRSMHGKTLYRVQCLLHCTEFSLQCKTKKNIDKWIKLVNFKLANEMWKVNWSTLHERGTKKNLRPDTNRNHDLSKTRRALYPLSYENSWRARSFNWVHMRQAWQIRVQFSTN